jgi:hypothetical protein
MEEPGIAVFLISSIFLFFRLVPNKNCTNYTFELYDWVCYEKSEFIGFQLFYP